MCARSLSLACTSTKYSQQQRLGVKSIGEIGVWCASSLYIPSRQCISRTFYAKSFYFTLITRVNISFQFELLSLRMTISRFLADSLAAHPQCIIPVMFRFVDCDFSDRHRFAETLCERIFLPCVHKAQIIIIKTLKRYLHDVFFLLFSNGSQKTECTM